MLVVLTDKQAKELEKYPNKSEVIRNALDVYIEHISTDTVSGLKQSYAQLTKYMRFKFEHLEKLIVEAQSFSPEKSPRFYTPMDLPPVTPACCHEASPCKHWEWNGLEQTYINKLTSEKREAVL